MFLVLLAFLGSLVVSWDGSKKRSGYISVDDSGELHFVPGKVDRQNGVVFGEYSRDLKDDGWNKLWIEGNAMNRTISKLTGKEMWYLQAKAAGMLEAQFTYEDIRSHFTNMNHYYFSGSEYVMPEFLKQWFRDQRDWMKEMIEKNPDDQYFVHMWFQYLQMNSMIDEFNEIAKTKGDKTIDYVDFQVVASGGDLWDLVSVHNRPKVSSFTSEELLQYFHDSVHCSALFKAAPDLSDIFFFHNTWFPYSWTLRIFKEYDFKFIDQDGDSKVSSYQIMFPSYPGSLSSIDDMYNTHGEKNDFTVIETTNSVFNVSIFDFVTPKSLLCWQRVQLSNRLAKDGEDWMKLFSLHNSGTYNNQWMVLDHNKFVPNKELKDGTFFVGEQIPGRFVYTDQTEKLRSSYWPSYNVPFYPEIFEIMGYEEVLKEHPELSSSLNYTSCARSQIFRRDNENVVDLETLKAISRYNDYKNDPLSLGSPSLSLASRHDLRDSNPECSGAFDAKASSVNLWQSDREVHVVSGPTTDKKYLVPFQWSTTSEKVCDPKSNSHEGIPDLLSFDWITIKAVN